MTPEWGGVKPNVEALYSPCTRVLRKSNHTVGSMATRLCTPAPERRDSILQGALRCFVERGFHGTTSPETARRAAFGSRLVEPGSLPNRRTPSVRARRRLFNPNYSSTETAGRRWRGSALNGIGTAALARKRRLPLRVPYG